ncbi:unnamed protein product [Urochloa humidicola]
MANPEAGHPRMPGDFLLRPDDDAAGRARLLINCGIVLISVAGSAIIHSAVDSTSTTTAAAGGLACALIAFLLGVSLVLVALAADLVLRLYSVLEFSWKLI